MDYDLDGIIDSIDLDDDNDGILDVDEGYVEVAGTYGTTLPDDADNQFEITANSDANQLVAYMFAENSAVTISNATVAQGNGTVAQIGTFDDADQITDANGNTGAFSGFGEGIIFGTGDIGELDDNLSNQFSGDGQPGINPGLGASPNNFPGSGTGAAGGGTDPDFNTGNGVFDSATLSWTMTVEQDSILTGQFVFASEEYSDFVNSGFNDNARIFVNGTNVALTPSGAPLSIDTINNNVESEFFVDNETDPNAVNIEADGFTTTITFTAFLNAGDNTIKIGIADEGDPYWDSWFLFQANSLAVVPVVTERDTDGDGIPDHLDLDSDNDGISDLVEALPSGTDIAAIDSDGNGQYDLAGTDNNNPGVDDAFTADGVAIAANSGAGNTPVDTSNAAGDNLADYLDLDSDDDGIADAIEAQGSDGYVSVSDGTSVAVDGFGVNTAVGLVTPVNSDAAASNGDAIADYRDTDSDGDGIADAAEGVIASNPVSYGNPDGAVTTEASLTDGSILFNADSDNSAPDYISLQNEAPTLTAFADVVEATPEDTVVEVSFSDIAAQGDEADSDGILIGFVVQSVSSGTLLIGADEASATAFAAGTNDVIDSNNNAYWLPDTHVSGNGLDAFTVVALDDAGAESATPVAVTVDVVPVADTPVIVASSPVIGDEDSAIAISPISVSTPDTDGSETLLTIISDIPVGAVLTDGTNTFTALSGSNLTNVTNWDLNNLQITPPAGSDEDFTLTIETTTQDGSDTASTQEIISVIVNPIADAPTVSTSPATGSEDTLIALNIGAELTDTDGSETLQSVVLADIPEGAVVVDGSNSFTATSTLNSVDVTNWFLPALQITPPADSDEDFVLTVVATSQDGSDTATTTETLAVTVNPVADTPTVTPVNAAGNEDTAIAIDFTTAATDLDGSETVQTIISDIPVGATLTDGTLTFEALAGSASVDVTNWDTDNLQIIPPADSDADFTLTVTAVSTDGTDTASNSAPLLVEVIPVADMPTVSTSPASGTEDDSAIILNISTAITDIDSSETLATVISDIPVGSTLSDGTNSFTATDGDTAVDVSSWFLPSLRITPTPDLGENFALTVTATSTDGTDTATAVGTLPVTMTAVADTPALSVLAATGDEDTEISLTIASAATDVDGSEAIATVVSAIPEGVTVKDGSGNTFTASATADAVDISTWDFSTLAVVPVADSDAEFALTVTAISTDSNGDTATSTETLPVTVNPVADAPTLTAQTATGSEDTLIPLSVTAALTDLDGSESLAIAISAIPEAVTLSDGTNSFTATTGSTTVDVSTWDLTALTAEPPADSDADFTLTITATSTDTDGVSAMTVVPLAVIVTAVADAPTVMTQAASGDEDTAIALSFSTALTDLDSSESLATEISAIPIGAELSDGTNTFVATTLTNSVDVTGWDLTALTITPPLNSDEDFTLTVTATSTDTDGVTAATSEALAVTVLPVADAPTVTTQAASGNEDSAIALTFGAALVDTDGSESLATEISAIPAGATLSDGTNSFTATATDSAVDVSTWDLSALTVTPPLNSDEDFALTITATSTDTDGVTATTSEALAVTVLPVADVPTVTTQPASGNEDTPIALTFDLALTDLDGSESLATEIAAIPEGATLSDGTNSFTATATESSVDVSTWDLSALTITPPLNSDEDFALTITATSTDNDGVMAIASEQLAVTVLAIADAPTVTTQPASGDEDTAIDLTLDVALVDADGSEALTIEVFAIPAGATLSDGTNSFTATATESAIDITAWDFSALTITPPANRDEDFTLTVRGTTTDSDGSTTFTEQPLAVIVLPVADAPTVITQPASGNEDTAIDLILSNALVDTDGSESLTTEISAIPAGATLSDGVNTFVATTTETAVEVTGWDLGSLTITPPLNSDEDFVLTVSATSTDTDGVTATTSEQLAVSVLPVADAPAVTTQPASGSEDTAIALIFSTELIDTDGTERLAIEISAIPAGATLTDGTNTFVATATETAIEVTSWDLTALSIIPPLNSDEDFALIVTSTSTDNDGVMATTAEPLAVTVLPVADAPIVSTAPAAGDEDSAIALTLDTALVDTDGSESLITEIAAIPAGAILTDGTNTFVATATENAVDVTNWDLDTLTITPPLNSGEDFVLTVTATSTDTDGVTATTSEPLAVTVEPVADAPIVSTQPASGNEDTAIALTFEAERFDLDSSESLTLEIAAIPAGAELSDGVNIFIATATENSVDITGWDLAALGITPPLHSDEDFTLSVVATSTDSNGDTATTAAPLNVTVLPVADQPLLSTTPATGDEDTGIAFSISTSLVDTDGSERLTTQISAIPEGVTLSDGNFTFVATDVANTVDISNWDFSNLTVTPVENSDADFSLTVESISTDGTDTATATESILITVNPIADMPVITTGPVTGNEDSAIAIPVSIATPDTDGSETLFTLISGIPEGASLTDGTNNYNAIPGSTTANVTGWDLSALQVIPVPDSDEDFVLTVTTTSQDGSSNATVSEAIAVTLNPVADAPAVTTGPAVGIEDSPIALSISADLTDVDGSETLQSIVISAIPEGATLTDGSNSFTSTSTEHSVDVVDWFLSGLQITPPADSDEDFVLTVEATSLDGTDTATTTATLPVTVAPLADTPTVTTQPANGDEDSAIDLVLSTAAVDIDGSEVVQTILSGIPVGATLTDGNNVFESISTSDSVDITTWNITSLQIVPPSDRDEDFILTVTAVSNDGPNTNTFSEPLLVTVNPVADAPTVITSPAAGSEDDAFIALDLDAALSDIDGSETLATILSDIPEGATLTDGTNSFTASAGNTAVDVSDWFLPSIRITPTPDSGEDFTLTLTATSTDGTDTATTVGTLPVALTPVADAPALSVAPAMGDEDSAIALSLAANSTDIDGSERVVTEVSDIPEGVVLTDGTNSFTAAPGDTTVDVSDWDLSALTVTPPADSDADFALTVTATSTDSNGDTAVSTDTIDVVINPIADAPIVITAPATGDEDTPIALSLESALTDVDGSESLVTEIAAIPAGATLTDGTNVFTATLSDTTVDVSDWTLSALTITPPADSDADFSLVVTATSTDGTDIAVTTAPLDVTVNPVADAPVVTTAPAVGDEDSAIALDITSSLTDLDASESLVTEIAAIPAGATLTDGTNSFTAAPGETTVDVSDWDLAALTITPPADSDADFTLTVTATSTDGTVTAVTTAPLSVVVNPVADAPILITAPTAGDEDTAIALSLESALTDLDGSEVLTTELSDIPEGATLTDGTNSFTAAPGETTVDVSDWDLAALTITPPADSDADFTLTVTATSTDGTDSAVVTQPLDVAVNPIADAPVVTTAPAAGEEDTAISLAITSALSDLDGSEVLTTELSGIPEGATLTDGANTFVSTAPDSVVDVSNWDLPALTITPPADSDADFTLTVTATSTDGTDTAVTTAPLGVMVNPVADTPVVTAAPATGDEDTAISLDLTTALTDVDNSEALITEVSEIPEGAILTDGTHVFTAAPGDTAIDISDWDFGALTITPPADSDADFTLTITATSTDGDDVAIATQPLSVVVNPIADSPVLTAAPAAGSEDEAISLNIESSLADVDGSEVLVTEISAIPEGATLEDGANSFTAAPGETAVDVSDWNLTALTITPPADSDADFTLTVTAISTDGADTATTTQPLDVVVNPVADIPAVVTAPAAGDEDMPISLEIASALLDVDGSEVLTTELSAIPEGATLTDGTHVFTAAPGETAVDVSDWDLTALTITPPADSDADFTLTVTATSTDGNETAVSTQPLEVMVNPVADAPMVITAPATGNEDEAIALSLTSTLTDLDGSESLMTEIAAVPEGAVLTDGINIFTAAPGETTVDVSDWDLSALSITPPANSDEDFTLTVTATSTDGTDTEVTSAPLTVSVNPIADAPVVTTAPATGNEDTLIALAVSALLTDLDASEGLTTEISDIPEGATLTDGTNTFISTASTNSVDVSDWNLPTLAITPPADSDGDFTLTVTATSADGSDRAIAAETLAVTVHPVADAPALETSPAIGIEDSAIALDIAPTLTDIDGSESLTTEVSGIPEGAILTDGTNTFTASAGDTTVDISEWDLTALTITPPVDSDEDFVLTIAATSTDGDDTATTTSPLAVTVVPDADQPAILTQPAIGSEDSPIDLNINTAAIDIDGSEDLQTVISDIPEGAVLTDGVNTFESLPGANSVDITDWTLDALQITPPLNSDQDFVLTVTATSADGDSTNTLSAPLLVTVDPVADAPALSTNPTGGSEDDGTIPLDLSVALVDADGSEVLETVISDIPVGTTLTDGTNSFTAVDGATSVEVSDWSLSDLSLSPTPDSGEDFVLTITATSTDGVDTATVVDTLPVSLTPVADVPDVALMPAVGNEDSAIALDLTIAAADIDGSEVLMTEISDIPEGAVLTDGTNAFTANANSSSTDVSDWDLSALTITPPADADADFVLTITATSTDGTDTATNVVPLSVTVNPIADAPVVTTAPATGDEDTPITLNLSASLTDVDGSEVLTTEISAIPEGATLTDGTNVFIAAPGDTAVDVSDWDLSTLSITPPADSDADFTLTVTATSTDGSDEAAVSETLAVTVDPVADVPVVTTAIATGSEDTPIALNLTSDLTDTDGSEVLTTELSGLPEGAILSDGTNTFVSTAPGDTIDISDWDFDAIAVTPPADSDADFTLSVTVTSTDGSDVAVITQPLDVVVNPVADAPAVIAEHAEGSEDSAIGLTIESLLTDIDGSETLTTEISTIPEGATLTDGVNVFTAAPGETAVDVSEWDLSSLSITPPADSDADFVLTITATSADGAETAVTTDLLEVTVNPVADAPVLTTVPAAGAEDTSIGLTIESSLTDVDGSEVLTTELSDIPEGATLTDGTNVFTAAPGETVVDISDWDFSSLSLTPPANSDEDFVLTVTVTSTDGTETAVTTDVLEVTVDPIADAPVVVSAPAAGTEDTPIDLTIESSLADVDGSEILTTELSGVPEGATLTDGTNTFVSTNPNDTVDVSDWNLSTLSITPPADSDADFTLTITATSTDGAETAVTTDTLDVVVNPVADAPVITTAPATGTEDTPIAISITSELIDVDGSETLTTELSEIPEGAVLTDGDRVFIGGPNNTSVDISDWDLSTLTITPPADSDEDFTLTITATSEDGEETAVTTETIAITVAPAADAPIVTTEPAAGSEDSAIALPLSTALSDADGSEALTTELSDIPEGATISDGDRTFTAGPGETTVDISDWNLSALTITPPENSDEDFVLTVTATSTDGTSTSSVVDTIPVTVEPIADLPVLNLPPASGQEGEAIALPITVTTPDTDGSESLATEIAGIPNGAVLTDGTNTFIGDGSTPVDVSDWNLSTLTLTPTDDSPAEIELTVTATSAEGGSIATASDILQIVVDRLPEATDDTFTVKEDSQGSALDVLVNDVDGGDRPLSIDSFTNPANGTISLDNSGTPDDTTDDILRYTPNADFSGTDTFEYTVIDADGSPSTATVTLEVNAVPDPVDDAFTGQEDTPISGNLLTDNGSGSDDLGDGGGGITAFDSTSANGGTVSVNPDGSFTYNPAADFSGTDSFTYTLTDVDGDESSATVNLTVIADLDDDNDGILDTDEGTGDTDGDGIPDYLDLDSDGDGISDLQESGLDPADIAALDTDGDGAIDDSNSFGDNGLADAIETQPESGALDYDSDGAADSTVDTDGDGVFDFQDLDADNDGINDVTEAGGTDANNDGIEDSTGTTDTDGDGMPDALDPDNSGTPVSNADTDGDGVSDFRDLDADNDGINDVIEAGNPDADGDGLVDGPDSDGDGIADSVDPTNGFGDQNDGPVLDSDGDGVANNLDLDSDNDGINDVLEGGNPDSNNDGFADGADSDGDGIVDSVDPSNGFGDDGESQAPDLDGDSTPNYLDLDSDSDGVFDLVEAGHSALDANNDGVIDGSDADGDGIIDAVDPATGFGDDGQNDSLDADNDGTADYLQVPANNNGGNQGTGGDDVIAGDDGNNVLNGLSDNDELDGGGGDDVVNGGSDVDIATGGSGNDVINGGSSGDNIDAGDGDDIVNGGSGDDLIYGGSGVDVINSGSGNDLLYGDDGDDLLTGGSGRDSLYGGSGVDLLRGGSDDDLLHGGDGDDLLYGGQGSDTFVYTQTSEFGDTISDFEIVRDRLDLSALFDDQQASLGNGVSLQQVGSHTAVFANSGAGDEQVALLLNVNADTLDSSNFNL